MAGGGVGGSNRNLGCSIVDKMTEIMVEINMRIIFRGSPQTTYSK